MVTEQKVTVGLFGHFFLAIWCAILATVVATAACSWLWLTSNNITQIADGPASRIRNSTAAYLLRSQGPSAVSQWLKTLPESPISDTVISKADGTTLNGAPITGARLAAFQKLVSQGSNRLQPVQYQGETWYVSSTHKKFPVKLLVPRNAPPFYLATALGILATVLLAALLAWRFSRPITRLDKTMKRFSSGDLNARASGGPGSGTGELARRCSGRPDEYLTRIESEVRRMDGLVGQLLEYARLDSLKEPVAMEETDLSGLLERVASDARFEGSSRQIRVAAAIEPGLVLKASPEYLHRAIENILRNSLAHSPANSCIELAARRQGGLVIIETSDQGPGVADADLPNIFRPFVRGANERTGTGHGLGLAIARQAVLLHAGSIQAANRPAGGFAVTVALPLDGKAG